jgi:hypothetical protein
MIDNMLSTFHTLVADDPETLNFGDVFQNELFGLSMTQSSCLNTSSVLTNTFSMLVVLAVHFWYCQHVPDIW